MKVSAFNGFQSFLRNDRLYLVLSLCFVLWLLWGINPLMSYEADSLRIANGVTFMHATHSGFPTTFTYQYNMQPLISALLLGLKEWVPAWGTEQIYCLLSFLFSVVFFFLCVEFVKAVLGINRLLVMFALFLLPESFAVMLYPNTAIFAAVPFLGGLMALWRNKFLLGAVLLCFAPLFRYDVLVVYPAVLGLFLYQGRPFADSLKRSVVLAVAVGAFFALGCWILGTNPFETIADLEGNGKHVRYSAVVLYVIFAFYNLVNFILLPWGIGCAIRKKRWSLLLMSLLPILMMHIAYSGQGTAAKHYLYLLPFIAMFTAPLIADILHNVYGKWCKWLFVVCIILYNVVSVRATIPKGDKPPLDTKQWMNQPNATTNIGPLVTIFTENCTPFHLRFGIGAGQVMSTGDERMLLTGNLFYPFYIHRFKQRWKDNIDAIDTFFEGKGDCVVCSGSVDALVAYANRFLEKGMDLSPEVVDDEGKWLDVYDFRKEGQRLFLLHEHCTDSKELFKRLILMSSTVNKEAAFYIVTLHDYECYCAEEFVKEGLLDRIMPNLYTLKSTSQE